MTYSESKWAALGCIEERMRDIVSQTSAISRGGLDGVLEVSELPGNPDGGASRAMVGGEEVGYGRTKFGDATIPPPRHSGPPKPRRTAAVGSSASF